MKTNNISVRRGKGNSIKIAMRTGIKFTSSDMWFDNVKILEQMGKDFNTPPLIALKDSKTVHDIYVVTVKQERTRERMLDDSKERRKTKPHLPNSKADASHWQ